jgi:hypothetical protein
MIYPSEAEFDPRVRFQAAGLAARVARLVPIGVVKG